MSKRILFLSKGEDSASTRYRALQYFPLLREYGFEVEHAPLAGGPRAYLRTLRRCARSDVVVVVRKTLPAPLLRVLRTVSRRLVFDFDDAIFCNTDGSPSATREQRFAAMVRMSEHVFAGNAYLAERALRVNPAVTIIPTSVDVGRYALVSKKPEETIDLVWIGSTSTRKYLLAALPALRLAAARIPGLRLKIIADFELSDPGLPTLAVPWNAATEAGELAAADIGIAPMRDDDWSRGKCALKILQYMACGLPVVSSDTGANAEAVDQGRTGYLVSDDEAWCRRLAELAGDAALRARLGTAGRHRVVANYSLEAVCGRLSSIFTDLS